MEVNQKELASCLGITARRVRELKQEGFFQMNPNSKKYDLAKCNIEYINYKVKAELGGRKSLNKEQEQAEHEKIKKEISKLKLRKLKKELHEAKDVESFLSEMLINFKNKLMSIPSKIAVQIVGEDDVNKIIAFLNKEMIDTLEELSEYDPDKIEGEDGIDYYSEDDSEIDEEDEEECEEV